MRTVVAGALMVLALAGCAGSGGPTSIPGTAVAAATATSTPVPTPSPTPLPTPLPSPTPTASPGVTPVPPTAVPSLPFAVTLPVDGTAFGVAGITVAGTGPVGARIVHDIPLAADDETIVRADGTWSIPVDLANGSNELKFRLGDDKATAIVIHLTRGPSEADATAALGTFLKENFGSAGYETPWWKHVKGWKVDGDTAVITTDLTKHNESAKSICSAASNFAFAEPSWGLRLGAVELLTRSGSVLWKRSAVADPC